MTAGQNRGTTGTGVKTGTANGTNGDRGAVVEAVADCAVIAAPVTTLGRADLAVKKLLRKEMGGSVVAVAIKATAAGIVALSLAVREWE